MYDSKLPSIELPVEHAKLSMLQPAIVIHILIVLAGSTLRGSVILLKAKKASIELTKQNYNFYLIF